MALLSTTPQTRAKAGRVRTVSQIAALIAAVAAGGAIGANFLRNPETTRPLEVEAPKIDPAKFLPPVDSTQAKADLEGIGSRMMMVSNSPKIAEVVKTDNPLPVAPPASIRDHVKFLGVVTDGARLFALIAIDGKQRIVGIGDVVKIGDQSVTVSAITADAVTLDDGKKPETIDRAHPSATAVSHSTAPANVPVAAAANANPGAVGKMPDHRGGPGGGATRAKAIKDLSGLDPKTRSIYEENRNALEAREMRRKVARQQLEKETGRSGEEIEKLLDVQEKEGKFDAASPAAIPDKKGGK